MNCNSPTSAETDEVVQNWDLISDLAQNEYVKLKKDIQNVVKDNGKAKFCKLFSQITELIEAYIQKDNTGTNERALICGYLYMGKLLAINTRQLMQLIGKCKSSINSGFQAIGYKVIPMDAESAVTLMKTFPFLKDQISLTRQWTLRSKDPYVKETESDIKAVLDKTLSETPFEPIKIEQKPAKQQIFNSSNSVRKQMKKERSPIMSIFDINIDSTSFQEPPSGASSAYTTPTPNEQGKDFMNDEQQNQFIEGDEAMAPYDDDIFSDVFQFNDDTGNFFFSNNQSDTFF